MSETYVKVTRLKPVPGTVMVRGAHEVVGPVLTGFTLPEARRIAAGSVGAAAWMSPDELMLFCGSGQGAAVAASLSATLEGAHVLVADVTDMRAHWRLDGAAVREVLAKITPADMGHLAVGEMRRSKLGQVAAGIWLESETVARVMAFRSVADYVDALLRQAARAGSEVG